MSGATGHVDISILDREYTVGVAPAERESLLTAAKALDRRMREIRGSNKLVSVDRVAVLAALNLAHEMEQLRAEMERRDAEVHAAIDVLQRKLDRVQHL